MKTFPTIFSRLTGGLLVVLAAGLSQPVVAQDPDSGGPTPTPSTPTSVPIDGGVALLLAAGAAYGVKRLRTRR
ncbi:hypothetical protein LJY25_03825 [Hymenobacter sp. BT175]|uniref:PID-CTERM protein-sorting domain-containing protein n=1 Tax=Hymenobacter translucens TaxID=2886507 RepID=UPI001D0EDA17|nr:hypothetical protein [Hymenobacter translucens]MCC2545561.1 hypothetical protein [Hymenobacter translucens]